jgi:dihydropyrimidinase
VTHYDTVVSGGEAVLPGQSLPRTCDVALREGRIAAIAEPGARLSADTRIDARGLTVLPGVIDAHVHFGLGSADDWTTESATAAQGGVTAVLSYMQDARSYGAAVAEEIERAESSSVIDFGLHCILMNELHLSEVDAYVEELGVTSFKYFTNFKGDEGAYMGVEGTDAGFFFELCSSIARHRSALLAVHTENIEVVWRLARRLREDGRDDLRAWTESRPDLVEAHDAFTAFLFGERTGCRIYIPHVSSRAALEVFAEHRLRGGRAVIETCPHYLTHTSDSDLGSLLKVNPPVRTTSDVEALWAAIADGTVSVVGSDHNSRRAERKRGSIWTASAGFPGVAALLPVMLSEGHHRRGVPLTRIAELLSTLPARIFGLAPRKGAIAVGADADLSIVDLRREQSFDASALASHSDYSIYDGWRLRGWPVVTIVRGRVVAREGELVDSAPHGRYLPRPLDAAGVGGRSAAIGRA